MSFRSMGLTRTSSRCCGASLGAVKLRNSSASWRRREAAPRRAAHRTTGHGLCTAWDTRWFCCRAIRQAYVRRGKNDAIDAEAICKAMSRPAMRFVPVKSAEQQAALRMLGVRDLLVKQRTMLINTIRGHAAEFGVTVAKGPKQVTELLQRRASDEGVPMLAREMVGMRASQLDGLDIKRKAIEARLMAWHRQDQTSQCLATIPGIGPIGGVSFALKSLPSRKRGWRIRRPFARLGTLHPGSGSRRARTRPPGDSGSARSAARAMRTCGGWATAVIRAVKPGRAAPWLMGLLSKKSRRWRRSCWRTRRRGSFRP
jgi:transposase